MGIDFVLTERVLISWFPISLIGDCGNFEIMCDYDTSGNLTDVTDLMKMP